MQRIHDWTYQWQIKLKPSVSKQVEEMSFSMKVSKPFPSDVHVNNNLVNSTSVYKHF